MPQKQLVWFILIIRMASGVILIAVWIILRPRQNIGGVLISMPEMGNEKEGLGIVLHSVFSFFKSLKALPIYHGWLTSLAKR
jgi:hypothetical protein